jgi:hypothetical protein
MLNDARMFDAPAKLPCVAYESGLVNQQKRTFLRHSSPVAFG